MFWCVCSQFQSRVFNGVAVKWARPPGALNGAIFSHLPLFSHRLHYCFPFISHSQSHSTTCLCLPLLYLGLLHHRLLSVPRCPPPLSTSTSISPSIPLFISLFFSLPAMENTPEKTWQVLQSLIAAEVNHKEEHGGKWREQYLQYPFFSGWLAINYSCFLVCVSCIWQTCLFNA